MGFLDKWMGKAGKKATKKAIKKAAKVVAQASPVVKTVQAGHAIVKLTNAASNFNEFVESASGVAKTVQNFIPEMQVMGKSLCDSAKIFGYFNMAATTIGISGNLVLTYQGIQALRLIAAKLDNIATSLAAQAALEAQRRFPDYVYSMIQERLIQTAIDPVCDHWFFLYHPDNDWYPKFYNLLEKSPPGPRFCGYSNQIDTVFIFMLAARARIEERRLRAEEKGRSSRPVKLHLLIPAYQPILIFEALKIPEEIGDFVMEGRINSNKEFVWLNLPETQRHYILDIGKWSPPTLGWWDWAMSKFGMGDKPPQLGKPRTLGTRQVPNAADESGEGENSEDEDDEGADGEGIPQDGMSSDDLRESERRNRHAATPLHHRHHHGPRRPRNGRRGEARGRSRESDSASRHRHRSSRPSRTPRST